ncbi:conserved hypothetical protein [Ricinus communis]|uniref:Uncharacterized protein n=1 Tax=Ricinus communis TaxID=3988 RepID=B9RA40_RICCO|nr:conserved hypothetical protein [Ricinus communis]
MGTFWKLSQVRTPLGLGGAYSKEEQYTSMELGGKLGIEQLSTAVLTHGYLLYVRLRLLACPRPRKRFDGSLNLLMIKTTNGELT